MVSSIGFYRIRVNGYGMRTWHPWMVCTTILIIACLLFSGCSTTEAAGHGKQPPASERMTPGELKDRVENAASYARTVGKEAAIAEFSKKDNLFLQEGISLYAYDFNGTLLADPFLPNDIGMNRSNFADIRGFRIIAAANFTAAAGGGFIAYLYPAPVGGAINESTRESYVPQIGYVCPVDSGWWIGSGIPLSDLAGSDPLPEPVSAMMNLEQRGANYGRAEGKEAAFREIGNRSGMFVDREGHYLTAYAYNCTVHAHPYLQDAVGKDLSGKKDAFGMEIVRSAADTAWNGGGFVVFIWPNPASGNRQEVKVGYMLPVDDEWWIGSGVYLSEITGEPAYYS